MRSAAAAADAAPRPGRDGRPAAADCGVLARAASSGRGPGGTSGPPGVYTCTRFLRVPVSWPLRVRVFFGHVFFLCDFFPNKLYTQFKKL